MYTCRLCGFQDVIADDVVLTFPSGKVLCLHCYHREVEDEKYMDKRFRKEVEKVLSAA